MMASKVTKMVRPLLAAIAMALAGAGAFPASAVAECELGCQAECKQEVAFCNAVNKAEAVYRKAECKQILDMGQAECGFEALGVLNDCIGTCGPDLSECKGEAKSILTECKQIVKEDGAACKESAKEENAEARSSCSEFATECASGCVE